jgi:hypothetical protein
MSGRVSAVTVRGALAISIGTSHRTSSPALPLYAFRPRPGVCARLDGDSDVPNVFDQSADFFDLICAFFAVDGVADGTANHPAAEANRAAVLDFFNTRPVAGSGSDRNRSSKRGCAPGWPGRWDTNLGRRDSLFHKPSPQGRERIVGQIGQCPAGSIAFLACVVT